MKLGNMTATARAGPSSYPPVRAALYHRISAAHDDDLEVSLGRQRSYAEKSRGWTVSEIFVDQQNRPSCPRPRFLELQRLIAAGRVDVIVTLWLDRLFLPGTQAVLACLRAWLGRSPPVHFVAIADRVDTTAAGQLEMWLGISETFGQLAKRHRSEASVAGNVMRVREGLIRHQIWDDHKLRRLYREGLSQRAIARSLAVPGHRPAQSSICLRLRALRNEGFLSEDDVQARKAAHEICPPSRGGRPRDLITAREWVDDSISLTKGARK